MKVKSLDEAFLDEVGRAKGLAQGSKGIRQWSIKKVTPSVDYNYWLKRLYAQLNE